MKTRLTPVIAAALAMAITTTPARADLASQLRRYVGYTIVDVKTITGWRDEDGKKGDSFEGCNLGRVIFFEGNKVATCASYGYQYAYRPDAVILFKQGDFKMIVEGDAYDMRR